MRLIDYFDRGADLFPDRPCLPKSIDFIAALPRSPAGKVLKKTLREPYWSGRARKI
jgi:acyl-CoA synthetase (AMP-forming)/AMP-acid ligase II